MRGSRSSSRGTKFKVDPNGCPSFFKIYSGESIFSERIFVPRAFIVAHEEKLFRSSWTLKTEDGGLRRVKIERHGTDSFISKRDWEEFASDRNLRFGDIIVFFLVGISEFEVMIFSQTTSCRILSLPTNKTAKADHDAFTSSDASSSDDDEDDDDDNFDEEEEIIKTPRKGRKSKRKSSCNYAHASGSGAGKRSKQASGEEIQVKTESTESEGEDGIQMKRFSNVNLTAKFPYFEIVVKKSHKYFIFVPIEFARKTGIIQEKVIKMMSSEKGSGEKVEIQRVNDNNRVHMVKGWESFRRANNIKVGDKCSFTLVNPNSHGTKKLLVKKFPNF